MLLLRYTVERGNLLQASLRDRCSPVLGYEFKMNYCDLSQWQLVYKYKSNLLFASCISVKVAEVIFMYSQ